MLKDFDHPLCGKEAAKCLLMLHQAFCSVPNYAVEFWSLEVCSGFGVEFSNQDEKNKRTALDDARRLDSLISLGI